MRLKHRMDPWSQSPPEGDQQTGVAVWSLISALFALIVLFWAFVIYQGIRVIQEVF